MQPAEFRRLIEEHARLLHGVALAYCRNPSDRDDVLQEIAIQLWRARERYDGRTKVTTWMYRIAINAAISCYRRERRHAAERLADDLAPPIASHGSAGARSTPGGTAASIDRDGPPLALQPVLRCLAALPALDRALVVLWLDDNDHATIAEVLGLSTSNVGTRLARIKQRLRDDLAHQEKDHGAR